MVLPVALLINLESSTHQGFRFHEPVGVLQQQNQVVEANGDLRMVHPVALFINLESAAHQGFRLQ